MQHIAGTGPIRWRPDASHLEGISVAAVALDVDGRVTYCNEAALALLGHPVDALLTAHAPSVIFSEPERGAMEEILAQVLDGAPWSGELPILCADDRVCPTAITCSPLWQADQASGALLVLEDLSGARAQRGRPDLLGGRLTRLARVTSELMMADSLEAVTKVVIEHSADAVGATVASLCLLQDPETLALLGLRGGTAGAASRWATFPLSAHTPAGVAVRTSQPLVLSGRDAIHERFPDLETAAEGERSMICYPLRVAGRPIGATSMSFPGRRTFDSAELEFFSILADTCAQAIDRMNAVAEAADQQVKLQFLADASEELASSLDYQTTLRKIAELAVPKYADWCSIQLVEDGELRTLAVAHVDPEKVALAEQMQSRYPPDRNAPRGAYHIVRTGVSELIPEIPDELLVEATQDEEHLRLARELNLRSALSVPLKARGQVIGVISWVAGEEGRRFGPADLAFGEDLARRAAVAIDNSQLHSEIREAAVRLQRAVLAEELPVLPGWQLASVYRPAGRTEVGGDFFDVVPLEDGRLAFFVGDVMGRGVEAAAAMAQMRSAVRAYLAVGPEPAEVLGKLDRMFAQFDIAQIVTLVYGVADPVADDITMISAGHPPPLLLRATGAAEVTRDDPVCPLGVESSTRQATRVDFGSGDMLLVFSDGLIERRTEDIDAGLRRLVEAVPMLAEDGLEVSLVRLVDRVRDPTRDDDVVALALRRTG